MRFAFKIYEDDYFVEWIEDEERIETNFDTVAELVESLIDDEMPVIIDLFQLTAPAGLDNNYVAFGTIKTALEMIPEVTDIECDDVPDSWDEPEMSQMDVEMSRREAAKALLLKFRR